MPADRVGERGSGYVPHCVSSNCREFRESVSDVALCISSSNAANLFEWGMRISLDTNVCRMYICDMKRISMFLSESQIAALKKASKRTGLKVSELIRRFIDEGLKRQ
jgi:hypothetical protein